MRFKRHPARATLEDRLPHLLPDGMKPDCVDALPGIPRLLHFAWLGERELPDRARECMESWRRHHPDWQLTLWTDESVQTIPMIDRAIYVHAPNDAERSDLLRHELLWRLGGVWVDVDVWCEKPIDPLLWAGCRAFVNAWGAHIENAVMGAAPNHPFFHCLIGGQLLWNSLNHREGTIVRGPRWVETMARLWIGEEFEIAAYESADTPTTTNGLTILPAWCYYRQGDDRRYGVHGFMNSWITTPNPFDEGRSPAGCPSASSSD